MNKTIIDDLAFDEPIGLDEPTEEELNDVESEMDSLFDISKYANTPFLHIKEIQQYRRLSPQELAELVNKRDEAQPNTIEYDMIINQIVVANLRFVVAWTFKLTHNMNNILDCIQVGYEGLIRAAKRFDLAKKCQFSTYASWWVRQYIRAFMIQDHCIHTTFHMINQYRQITKFRNEFMMKYFCEPDYSEVSKATGISIEKICALENVINIDSIDRPLLTSDDKDSTLGMLLEADVNVEDEVITKISYEKLYASMNKKLNATEYQVLTLRYGLNGNREQTLEEVGKVVNLSRERVRQIEDKALKKLNTTELRKTFLPTNS